MDNDPDYENYDICKTEIDSHKHHDFICCFHPSPLRLRRERGVDCVSYILGSVPKMIFSWREYADELTRIL